MPWGEVNHRKGETGEKNKDSNKVSEKFGDNPNDVNQEDYEESAKVDSSKANGEKDSGFDEEQTPDSKAYVEDAKLKDRLDDKENHPDDDTFLKFDPNEGLDPDKYAVLLNDWPYCLPYGVRHYCVWSRVPIAHPKLVDYDEKIYDDIQENGLHGFTGIIPIIEEESKSDEEDGAGANGPLGAADGGPPKPVQNPEPDAPVPELGLRKGGPKPKAGWYVEDIKYAGEELRRWAGVEFEAKGAHEVSNMVRGLWDPRGWECLFFVNPAVSNGTFVRVRLTSQRLQSIPAYAHFHVFARRKTPDEIDISEKIWGTLHGKEKDDHTGTKDKEGTKAYTEMPKDRRPGEGQEEGKREHKKDEKKDALKRADENAEDKQHNGKK